MLGADARHTAAPGVFYALVYVRVWHVRLVLCVRVCVFVCVCVCVPVTFS